LLVAFVVLAAAALAILVATDVASFWVQPFARGALVRW
jgi:hypothetical protein